MTEITPEWPASGRICKSDQIYQDTVIVAGEFNNKCCERKAPHAVAVRSRMLVRNSRNVYGAEKVAVMAAFSIEDLAVTEAYATLTTSSVSSSLV